MSKRWLPFDETAEMQEWGLYDSFPFNRQFDMKEYEQYMTAQTQAKAPFTLGGRRWWEALGHVVSVIITLLAIAVEVLFILRDATATVTTLPSAANDDVDDDDSEDAASVSDATSTATAQRFARHIVIRAAKNATKAAKQAAANGTAASSATLDSNYTCQWVNNTDVLNNASGQPLAVSFHFFTVAVLFILAAAQFQLWRRAVHPSSMVNIGIVQLWVGLSILSRSMDLLGVVVGFSLLAAGMGNLVFGAMARFLPGGPGMSLFRTGQSMEQMAQAEGIQAAAAKMYEDSAEQAQAAVVEKQKQEEISNTAAVMSGMPTTQYQHQMLATPIDPTLASASGYETPPLMSQLAALNNNSLYQTIMGQGDRLSARRSSQSESEIPTLAPPAHLLSSPYDSKTRSKLWRQRMPLDQ